MQTAGFTTVVEETTDVAALKSRLGVPDDLASCHTAVIAGYAIEGHVPASAIRRLLTEQPSATGLAVPGMPGGAPGMGAQARLTKWFCLVLLSALLICVL